MRVSWRRYIARRGIDFDQWVVDMKLTSYDALRAFFETRNVEPPERADVLHLVGPASPVKPILVRSKSGPPPVVAIVEKPIASIRDNKARLLELSSKMKVEVNNDMTNVCYGCMNIYRFT